MLGGQLLALRDQAGTGHWAFPRTPKRFAPTVAARSSLDRRRMLETKRRSNTGQLKKKKLS